MVKIKRQEKYLTIKAKQNSLENCRYVKLRKILEK